MLATKITVINEAVGAYRRPLLHTRLDVTFLIKLQIITTFSPGVT